LPAIVQVPPRGLPLLRLLGVAFGQHFGVKQLHVVAIVLAVLGALVLAQSIRSPCAATRARPSRLTHQRRAPMSRQRPTCSPRSGDRLGSALRAAASGAAPDPPGSIVLPSKVMSYAIVSRRGRPTHRNLADWRRAGRLHADPLSIHLDSAATRRIV
jgi:hypothetical protein